jgi:hypothetical protein
LEDILTAEALKSFAASSVSSWKTYGKDTALAQEEDLKVICRRMLGACIGFPYVVMIATANW